MGQIEVQNRKRRINTGNIARGLSEFWSWTACIRILLAVPISSFVKWGHHRTVLLGLLVESIA